MGRMPVPDRIAALSGKGCPSPEPWRIIRRFHRLSARRGLVAYALRTRAPLSRHPKVSIPYDLHVLGLPLAFILSQDQTLRCTIVLLIVFSESRVPPRYLPPVSRGSLIPRAASRGAGVFVLASDFQRTFRFPSPFFRNPSLSGKAGAKVQLFSLRATSFLLFLKIFYISLIYNDIFYFISQEFSQY